VRPGILPGRHAIRCDHPDGPGPDRLESAGRFEFDARREQAIHYCRSAQAARLLRVGGGILGSTDDLIDLAETTLRRCRYPRPCIRGGHPLGVLSTGREATVPGRQFLGHGFVQHRDLIIAPGRHLRRAHRIGEPVSSVWGFFRHGGMTSIAHSSRSGYGCSRRGNPGRRLRRRPLRGERSRHSLPIRPNERTQLIARPGFRIREAIGLSGRAFPRWWNRSLG
jgi:hypothetical protein